jgi:hypothetical protein
MEISQLEKLRDQVCVSLTSQPVSLEKQTIIDALIQIPIRDGLLRFLYDHPEHRNIVSENLETLLDVCVEHERAALATILAGNFWLDSDLELTRNSLDQALLADPTYSLARLLDVALTHGVPAKVWADSLAAVSPQQCLSGAA